jgi:hypothetical protein
MILESFVAPTQFPSHVMGRPPELGAAGEPSAMVSTFLAVRPGQYDNDLAYWLMVAAGWAYAEGQELANVMGRQGFGECIVEEISCTNNAMFVTATAFLIRSRDGKVGILCFRGTEPNNIITWVLDASIAVVPFAGGMVHGGFYRNVQCIWNYIFEAVEQARRGDPVIVPRTSGKVVVAADGGGNGAGGANPPGNGHHHKSPRRLEVAPLECLYITGHSLGAAMAVIAAAEIFVQQQYAAWREPDGHKPPLLRGIYTFGQPMIGDRAMASNCEHQFGRLLFRHVYDHDVVPRLPPWTTGQFRHFGAEYHGSSSGWSLRSKVATQCISALVSLPIGAAAWVFQQFPLLRRIRLPYSFMDHSPLNYLDASRAVVNRTNEWR